MSTHDAVDGHDFAENDTIQLMSSQRYYQYLATDLIKFLVLIRGARTPPPRMDEPVMKIPLGQQSVQGLLALQDKDVPPRAKHAQSDAKSNS